MDLKIERKPAFVLLSAATITPQHLSRMGLNILTKSCEIYIFDCRTWFKRQYLDEIGSVTKEYNLIKISSSSNFQEELERICPEALLDFIGKSELSLEIRKIALRTSTILVAVNRGSIPSPGLTNRIRYSIEKRNRNVEKSYNNKAGLEVKNRSSDQGSDRYIWSAFRIKMRNILLNIKYLKYRPHISMISGKKGLDFYYLPSKKIFWVKSIDAAEFQTIKKKNESSNFHKKNEKNIVFIDDNIDSSLDWLLLNQSSPVSKFELYEKLNKIFSLIESKTRMPILIAAHPTRERNSELSTDLNKRKVVHDNTAEIIMQSNLVLNLTSGAVGLAVLAKKPIIFLTSNALNSSHMSLINYEMKRQLRCQMINVDDLTTEVASTNEINIGSYRKYEKNYMDYKTQDSESIWDTLLEEVQKIRVLKGI